MLGKRAFPIRKFLVRSHSLRSRLGDRGEARYLSQFNSRTYVLSMLPYILAVFTTFKMSSKVLQIGVIGGGDVAQIVHLPTFMFLSGTFKVKTICDISQKTADHCAARFGITKAVTDPNIIFQDSSIDAVVVLTSDEYHAPYAVASLKAGKHVLVEKPISLSMEAAQEIIEAEMSAPNGARVFVGYMRRYAPSLQAFKREIANIGTIKYARVRDIIGPNAYFIGQSGANPVKTFEDVAPTAADDRKQKLATLLEQAWARRSEI